MNLLFRVNGSAIYRAAVPGLLSTIVLILIRVYFHDNDCCDDQVKHPYAIGILVTSITFLLVFRVQQAYARYWEAASAIHHMMSKWMDAVVHTAAYHMQSTQYDAIKPPSYSDYAYLDHEFLTRDREPVFADENESDAGLQDSERIVKRATKYSIERVSETKKSKLPKKMPTAYMFGSSGLGNSRRISSGETNNNNNDSDRTPTPLMGPPRLDGNWSALYNDDGTSHYTKPNQHHSDEKKDAAGFASFQGGRTPPLFLQELAHLASLCTGVALSTLRNDIEGAQSPLDVYQPGEPWPEVDPGLKFEFTWDGLIKSFWYFLGTARNPAERTKYNASRPLPVIGGVSEGEIHLLQMARGPYAKTQLSWMWLSEFIIREHLAGSTGRVGPPIISRIIQFLGDGMIYYNHARKIMFIPWPFPHAQLSAIYVLVIIPAVAGLMDQYIEQLWMACLLVFFTVTCLHGIHEVARELENPFRNIPNELPLVTFQAQYNEALYVTYAGYHPDHFWKDEAKTYAPPPPPPEAKPEQHSSAPSDSSQPHTGLHHRHQQQQQPQQPHSSTTAPSHHPASPKHPSAAAPHSSTTRMNGGIGSGGDGMCHHRANLEKQLQEVMKKMEEQAKELEELRAKVEKQNEPAAATATAAGGGDESRKTR